MSYDYLAFRPTKETNVNPYDTAKLKIFLVILRQKLANIFHKGPVSIYCRLSNRMFCYNSSYYGHVKATLDNA